MSAPTSYSRTQIVLHWLVVVLVTFQIVAHEGIEELWEARMDGDIPNVATPTPHTIVGLLIFALMIWRLVLRLRHGVPALPENEHPLMKFAAHGTHGLIYLFLLLIPISGAVAWFGSFEQAADAHEVLKNILLVLIVVHIGGALAQHFVFKTDVLKRIVGRA